MITLYVISVIIYALCFFLYNGLYKVIYDLDRYGDPIKRTAKISDEKFKFKNWMLLIAGVVLLVPILNIIGAIVLFILFFYVKSLGYIHKTKLSDWLSSSSY